MERSEREAERSDAEARLQEAEARVQDVEARFQDADAGVLDARRGVEEAQRAAEGRVRAAWGAAEREREKWEAEDRAARRAWQVDAERQREAERALVLAAETEVKMLKLYLSSLPVPHAEPPTARRNSIARTRTP
mmetsp:Transcript_43029/g.102378  ORF Transcript_43029/g.102378 Transcript_43029/m.102378 type:complete len:135 (+) Transcript_43029:2-406(+)